MLLNDKLFLRDLVLTLLAAILTGVSSSILLILLIFSWGAVEAGSLHEEAAKLPLVIAPRYIPGNPVIKETTRGYLPRGWAMHTPSPGESGIGTGYLLSVRNPAAGGELRYMMWAEAESAERFGLESGAEQNTITKHHEADPHISSSRLPAPGVSG